MSFTGSVAEIVERNDNGLLASHESWVRVSLRDVAKVLNGFAFPSSMFSRTSGIPLLRIRDILGDVTEASFDGPYEPAYLVQPGELVIGMDGDFNCSVWKGPEALLNQRVCKLMPSERFYDRRLLAYALPGYLSAINAKTSSITVKHLSSKTVEEIPLPLPPVAEQHRIVQEIEKQLTRFEAAVAALERTRANLKRYRASVLRAACAGRLVSTEAEMARAEGREYEPADQLLERILKERRARWEADELAKMQAKGMAPKDDGWKAKYQEPPAPETANLPELPEGWVWSTLGQVICEGPQNGLYKPAAAYGDGTPILRIDDYQNGFLRPRGELRCLGVTADEAKTYGLNPGDLVINRVNSPSHLGKCAVVPSTLCPAVFESNMMRIAVATEVAPKWVSTYVWSSPGRTRLTARAKWAVNQASINQTDVCLTPVPLPPYAEQRRIVAELERRLSVNAELEIAIGHGLRRAERLRQSILKCAFEGRVVAQDPNDEPASVLLERIRAERSSAGQAQDSRRKGRGQKRRNIRQGAAASQPPFER